ncbi:MAG: TlpA disulfide reductase family protein [Lachnospiraceae bacterium]|nr:TlpA disulfide reductase family protein [Lachnospiraceae bacterium]
MGKKKKFMIVLILFILLLAGAYALYTQLGQNLKPDQLAVQEQQETEEEKEDTQEKISAPDFKAYDIDGNEIQLSDYIGKPIVLNFWASWCGPCKMEIPDFEEKYLKSGDEIQFLMINMTDGSRETIETASSFIEEQEYTFPVFYDTELDAANTYQVYSLPTTYFIDSEGYIIAKATGAIDGETLQKGIDLIF